MPQIDGGGPKGSGGGSSITAGDGLLLLGSVMSVLPDGDSVAVSPSGLKSAVLTPSDKNLTPLVTVGDGSYTGITLANTPSGNGFVGVFLNMLGPYLIGDGTKLGVAFWFSGDLGATARQIQDLVAGDRLYYNGATVGFELTAQDRINLMYQTTI